MESDLVADFGNGAPSAEVSIEIVQGSGTVAIELWDVLVEERSISLYPLFEELPCLVELSNEDTQ